MDRSRGATVRSRSHSHPTSSTGLPACDSTGGFVSQNAGFYSPARKCGDSSPGFVSQNTTKLGNPLPHGRGSDEHCSRGFVSQKSALDSDNPARQCGDFSSWLRFAEPKTRRANQPVLRNFEENPQRLHQNRAENTKAKSRPCYKEVASPYRPRSLAGKPGFLTRPAGIETP